MAIQHELTLSETKKVVAASLKAGITPILKSQPGVGKSALINQIAKERNLEVIDVRLSQCDSSDLLGIPNFNGKKASYHPMDIFPLEGDPIPEGKKGWVLFLDELGNAETDVMKAAYKVVYDRMIGNQKIHDKCYIVCATNREADGCFVNPMPAALKSRLLHINVRLDVQEWLRYAAENALDGRILSFIAWDNGMLATNFIDSGEESYGCPRSWEAVSKYIKDIEDLNDPLVTAAIAGLVGTAQQIKFTSFFKYFKKIPTYEDVVKNPVKAKLNKDDLGCVWASIGMLLNNYQEKDTKQVVEYVLRMNAEHQYAFAKLSVLRQPKLLHNKEAMKLTTQLMDELE